MSGAADLTTTVHGLLDDVDGALDGPLQDASRLLLDTVRADGLIWVAGAGHSLAMVCETFYRAGGLACVRPLWHPDIFPLTSALGSTRAERRVGLGAQVVREADVAEPSVAVVFSTSGSNPYPVEVAAALRRRSVEVVAVTSGQASAGAARRSGDRLLDHASIVLDTAVPAGDVVFPPASPRTAAVSTLSAAYVWARLLAELDDAAEAGQVVLPRWRSANVPDGDRANAALMSRYGPVVPELGTGDWAGADARGEQPRD
ncbi:sugar isomerase domain-containing protein [Aeromicrobium sp. CTD01-1L150]|uniref:sugar isomerase domain-containing protein n=1 Tax=Aeromicrobium sp. CTD01-1L150 TaxID=3341830 RepID=UPI0035C195CC